MPHDVDGIRPSPNVTAASRREMVHEGRQTRQSIGKIVEALARTYTSKEIDQQVFAFDHFPMQVESGGAQVIADSTFDVIDWDVLKFDTYGYYDITNRTDIYLRIGGVYRFTIAVAWEENATGKRLIFLRRRSNPTTYFASHETAAQPVVGLLTGFMQETTVMAEFESRDEIYVEVLQSSGGDLGINYARLEVERVRPNAQPRER